MLQLLLLSAAFLGPQHPKKLSIDQQRALLDKQRLILEAKLHGQSIRVLDSGTVWLNDFMLQPVYVVTMSSGDELHAKKEQLTQMKNQYERGDFRGSMATLTDLTVWASGKAKDIAKAAASPNSAEKTKVFKNLKSNYAANWDKAKLYFSADSEAADTGVEMHKINDQIDALDEAQKSSTYTRDNQVPIPESAPPIPPSLPWERSLPSREKGSQMSDSPSAPANQVETLKSAADFSGLDDLVQIERWLDLGNRAFDDAVSESNFYQRFPDLERYRSIAEYMSPRTEAELDRQVATSDQRAENHDRQRKALYADLERATDAVKECGDRLLQQCYPVCEELPSLAEMVLAPKPAFTPAIQRRRPGTRLRKRWTHLTRNSFGATDTEPLGQEIALSRTFAFDK